LFWSRGWFSSHPQWTLILHSENKNGHHLLGTYCVPGLSGVLHIRCFHPTWPQAVLALLSFFLFSQLVTVLYREEDLENGYSVNTGWMNKLVCVRLYAKLIMSSVTVSYELGTVSISMLQSTKCAQRSKVIVHQTHSLCWRI
jgi:hypothetical protein